MADCELDKRQEEVNQVFGKKQLVKHILSNFCIHYQGKNLLRNSICGVAAMESEIIYSECVTGVWRQYTCFG